LEHKLFDQIVYYGDTARVPYGTRDKQTIIRYSLEALEFFRDFDIDLLITACNTVSAHALPQMRAACSHEIVGVIEPGIRALQDRLSDRTAPILVIGTRATIASNRYQNALHALGYTNLAAMQTGLFVPLVEEGIFEGALLQETMRHYFDGMPDPAAVILGCTHFPLISEAIAGYFGTPPMMIHSGEAIVAYLEEQHGIREVHEQCDLRLFASDDVEGLRTIAKSWLGAI
jgi:glutamate racemase